jgi:hypothetical protein
MSSADFYLCMDMLWIRYFSRLSCRFGRLDGGYSRLTSCFSRLNANISRFDRSFGRFGEFLCFDRLPFYIAIINICI